MCARACAWRSRRAHTAACEKPSTDTPRLPACRYDLNGQPDEGQVGAVFESVPKLTRTPRGLGVLYVRATRNPPPHTHTCCTYQRRLTLYVLPGTRTSLGRAARAAYRGYHPRSVLLAYRSYHPTVPWLPPQVGPASRRHAHREASTVLRLTLTLTVTLPRTRTRTHTRTQTRTRTRTRTRSYGQRSEVQQPGHM